MCDASQAGTRPPGGQRTTELAVVHEADEEQFAPPPSLTGSLLKASPFWPIKEMKRRFVAVEDGRVYWSMERGPVHGGYAPGCRGFIDLSSPCEVQAGSGSTFCLKPLDGSWVCGNFNGVQSGRVFTFDAAGSEHPRERWLEVLQAHITWAARHPASAELEYSWMWGDSGTLIGHALARQNPFRWSPWKTREATTRDLEYWGTDGQSRPLARPVEMWIGRGQSGCTRFKSVAEALEALRADRVQPTSAAASPSEASSVRRVRRRAEFEEFEVEFRQAEGFPEVRVFLEPERGAAVVGEVANGESGRCVAEHGEFLQVQWKQLEGWVGRKNVARPGALGCKAAAGPAQLEACAPPAASPEREPLEEPAALSLDSPGLGAAAPCLGPGAGAAGAARAGDKAGEGGEPGSPDVSPATWQRHVDDVLAGLSASGARHAPGGEGGAELAELAASPRSRSFASLPCRSPAPDARDVPLPSPKSWGSLSTLETPPGRPRAKTSPEAEDSMHRAQRLFDEMTLPSADPRGRRARSSLPVRRQNPLLHSDGMSTPPVSAGPKRRASSCSHRGDDGVKPLLQPLNGRMKNFPPVGGSDPQKSPWT